MFNGPGHIMKHRSLTTREASGAALMMSIAGVSCCATPLEFYLIQFNYQAAEKRGLQAAQKELEPRRANYRMKAEP
jgi:hypothetical protein